MEELMKLIGAKLQYLGRAVDLCWLGFGNLISVPNYKGGQRTVAEYALHIQSAFRLWKPGNREFCIGYSDVFNPCGGSERSEDFNWDIQGGNFYDEKVKALQENIELMDDMIVEAVEVNELFDLKIIFANGFLLETFSECFCESVELWRFFEPDKENTHWVVIGTGFQEQ